MKKALKAAAFAVLFALALPLQAMAASKAEVALDTTGEKAGVNITLPQNTGKGVTALELHIQVENMADAAIDFEFSNQVNATVQQARYNESKKELVVYVAGGKNLFVNDTVFLGKVVANSDVEGQVELSVQDGALKLADGVYAVSSEEVEPVQAVLYTQGKDDSKPEQPDSSSSSSSSDNSSSNGSSSSSSGSSSGSSSSTSSSGVASSSSSSSNSTSSGGVTSSGGSVNAGTGVGTGATGGTSSIASQSASASTSKGQSSSASQQQSASGSSEQASSEQAESASQSASSQPSSTVSTEKDTADNAVWIAVAVLAVAAIVVVGIIVVRKKNS